MATFTPNRLPLAPEQSANGIILKRYWHIAIALALAAIFGFATWHYLAPGTSESAKEPDQKRSDAYTQGGASCSPDDFRRIKSDAKRRAQEDNCSSVADEHRTEQDALSESARATAAAENANKLSFKQAQAAALQSAALIITLIIGAWAALEAKGAVEATREVGRDQARAYVHIEKAETYWGDQRPTFITSARNRSYAPSSTGSWLFPKI